MDPEHEDPVATIKIYDTQDVLKLTKTGKVLFNDQSGSFKGTIDTIFISNKTLAINDLQDLYDGMMAKAQLQVRSCDDADCSGETFVGKDGTASSYFDNMSFPYTLNESITPTNQYIQWKLELNSYDRMQSPDVINVTIGTATLSAPVLLDTALNYTNNGAKSICTSESCQVYKPQLKLGKWKEAVQATRGWVMTKDGNAAATYFSASTGGYTISQWGWSGIKDASGSWPDTAYEKVAGSPWFYKGWYKSRGGATCGRTNPWLSSSEMADILNAWKVLFQGGGDVSRVSPVGSCWGGNPYSQSDLTGIGGYTSVSGVSVVYSNDGSTQSVTFSTNQGSVNIPGADFKKAFNLRAPGYIGLKSSLYNIEKL